MFRVFLFFLLLLNPLLAEPSVYGNYGSSSSRGTNSKSLMRLKEQVSKLQEEIDGLRSIIRGLQQKLNRVANQNLGSSGNSGQIEDILYRLNKLERAVNRKSTSIATASTPKKPKVSKPKKSTPKPKPPKKVAKKEDRPKTPPKPTKPKPKPKIITVSPKEESKKPIVSTTTSSQKKPVKKLTSQELLKSVKDDIANKSYQKAEDNLNLLIKRGYKRPECYYLLGEIAYNKGRYSDAIELYQKSAEKSADSYFMDRLLLHTAISLKKSGQKAQAKEFFKTVIDAYPNSISASTAKRYLKSMR